MEQFKKFGPYLPKMFGLALILLGYFKGDVPIMLLGIALLVI